MGKKKNKRKLDIPCSRQSKIKPPPNERTLLRIIGQNPNRVFYLRDFYPNSCNPSKKAYFHSICNIQSYGAPILYVEPYEGENCRYRGYSWSEKRSHCATECHGLYSDRVIVTSDLHFGDSQCDMEAFKRLVRKGILEGYGEILFCGDFLCGRKEENPGKTVRFIDKTYNTPDLQIEKFNGFFPEQDEVRFYLIGGNHDVFCDGKSGDITDYAQMLCKGRSDFTYLGPFYGEVKLESEQVLCLAHPPSNNVTSERLPAVYAESNRFVSGQLSGGRNNTNPKDIIFLGGNGHKLSYSQIDNRDIYGTGSFLRDSISTRHLGAWLIDFGGDGEYPNNTQFRMWRG
ncbi:MAG: metallophosphoesterase [Candidatus Aenigmatarchaeota archaeon]